MTCHPGYTGSIDRRITVQAGPRHKFETLFKKQLKQKGLGGVAQVVEILSSKHNVLR
jgi:hypothetical protein